MTTTCPSEYLECLELVKKLTKYQEAGKVRLFTHIPNETFTKSWGVKMKNKAMGVRPGMVDYIITTDKDILFIEMKKRKGGQVSPFQKAWLAELERLDIPCRVCHGAQEAIEFIERYL